MSEPLRERPCQSPANSKPYAYTHFALRVHLLFISAVLVVLSCQSRQAIATKMSKPTLHKREIDRSRVAICLAGETRTFYYPGVHKSILKRAIQPLQREGFNLDVFFIIRLVGDMPSKHYKKKIYKAIKLFNATKVIEYTGFENMRNNFDPDRFGAKPYEFYRPPKRCKGKEKFSIRFSHSLYRTQHCLDVISEHERKHRFYYHWVYRLRPDIALLGDEIPTPRTLSDDVLYVSAWATFFDKQVRRHLRGLRLKDTAVFIPRYNYHEPWGAGDQFFSASRQVAQVAFNAFEISNGCSVYAPSVRNSESCLLLYLAKNKVPYAAMPVLWEIVQYDYNLSCKTAEDWVFVPNTDHAIRSRRCRKFWEENARDLPKPTSSG